VHCDSPHKTETKILPKIWTLIFPKEPKQQKSEILHADWDWFTRFCQGNFAPLVAPAVPKRGRSCQAHEVLVVVKVVSPLHVCILHKKQHNGSKMDIKTKENELIGIEDSGSKLDV